MRIVFFIIPFLITLYSCSAKHSGTKDHDSELELYNDGVKRFEKRDFEIAIEKLEKLLNDYPLSKYSIDAELLIANSRFELREYLEAVVDYKEFYKLHPMHEKIPFVLFRIGEGYYHQSPKQIDRDQTNLEQSLFYLEELLSKYPKCIYANDARMRLSEIRIKFASRIKYIANYYMRKKIYNACVLRFGELSEKFSDLGYNEEAEYKKAYCLIKLNKKDEAMNILKELNKKNHRSEYVRRAEELIKQ